MVYAIAIRGRFGLDTTELGALANATGGRSIELRSGDDIPAAMRAIADELHQQYVIGFSPAKLDDKLHRLDVKVNRSGVTVRARRTVLGGEGGGAMRGGLRAAVLLALAAAALIDARQSTSGGSSTIWLAVNVIHKDGHLVSNLSAADFEIEDNGAKREVTTFRNDPIPIAVAIMVDVSSSMESNYSLVRRAVSALTTHFRPGDRAIVGSFNSLPWISDRFSARPEVLQKSLAAVFGGRLALCDGDWIDRSRIAVRSEQRNSSYGSVNEFSRRMSQPGGSAIWDGAACGVNAVASDGETPRRIVILVTDGVDNMSFGPMPGVISRANLYGVMIYAVSVMGGYGMAGSDLKSLAESTGGGYFYLTGEDQVADAFTRIGDELRHQVHLRFCGERPPPGHARDCREVARAGHGGAIPARADGIARRSAIRRAGAAARRGPERHDGPAAEPLAGRKAPRPTAGRRRRADGAAGHQKAVLGHARRFHAARLAGRRRAADAHRGVAVDVGDAPARRHGLDQRRPAR